MKTLTDDMGAVELGDRIGSGGEGTVHAIANRPKMLAKIFHKPPTGARLAKLEALVNHASSADLQNYAAWPSGLIWQDGNVVGLKLPFAKGRHDIHKVYGPRSRKQYFPNADWRFLVRVAANTARAFAAVHESGCVIGDVNHGGVLIGQDATVMLIDCDSFQLEHEGKIHLCGMGVPTFTPPELQGRSLRRVKRTVNQDCFGLAVLIFQILFMGRHPHAGRFQGRGDKPIEDAIAEFRFAYGPGRKARKMEPPPGMPDISIATEEIAALFEQAFGEDGPREGNRPPPEAWTIALASLEEQLVACSQNHSHRYPHDLETCPWCEIETAMGTVLFHFTAATGRQGGPVNVTALWAEIEAIPKPEDEENLLALLPEPEASKKAIVAGYKVLGRTFGPWILAFALIFWSAGFLPIPWWIAGPFAVAIALYLRHRYPADVIVMEFRREAYKLHRREESYHRGTGKMARLRNFNEHYFHLQRLRDELAGMDRTLRERLQELESSREQFQRDTYSNRFPLTRADIPGFGPTRLAMLASYGLETVGDLNRDRLVEVPGIGEVLAADALEWRLTMEKDFRFDPSIPLEKERIQKVENEIRARRAAIVEELRAGPKLLKATARDIENARKRRMPKMKELRAQKLQAEVDAREVGSSS